MKIFSQSAIDGLGLVILKKVLFYATLLVTGVISLLLFQIEAKYHFKWAGFAAAMVFLFGLFTAFFSLPSVIEKMSQNKGMFLSEAIMHTVYSYVMVGSFLPIIGPLVGRILVSRKSRNPFAAHDD